MISIKPRRDQFDQNMMGSGNQVLNNEALNDYGYGNNLDQTNLHSQTGHLLNSINESNDQDDLDDLIDDEDNEAGRATGPMISVFD